MRAALYASALGILVDRDDEGYLYIAQDTGGIIKIKDDVLRPLVEEFYQCKL